MWSDIERDLAEILATRVFPTLGADPGYVRMFRNAGLPGKLPPDVSGLPPVVQRKLAEAARMCAQLLTMQVEGFEALRERRAKAVVLEGSMNIYRLWSSKESHKRIGPWWFTEGLLTAGDLRRRRYPAKRTGVAA